MKKKYIDLGLFFPALFFLILQIYWMEPLSFWDTVALNSIFILYVNGWLFVVHVFVKKYIYRNPNCFIAFPKGRLKLIAKEGTEFLFSLELIISQIILHYVVFQGYSNQLPLSKLISFHLVIFLQLVFTISIFLFVKYISRSKGKQRENIGNISNIVNIIGLIQIFYLIDKSPAVAIFNPFTSLFLIGFGNAIQINFALSFLIIASSIGVMIYLFKKYCTAWIV